MSKFELDQENHTMIERLKHFFYEHALALSLAFSRLSRVKYQSIASVILIGFSMGLCLIFGLIIKNTFQLSKTLSQGSTMTVYPVDNLSVSSLEALKVDILKAPLVTRIDFIGPDQISKEVFQDSVPDYLQNTLPTLLSVELDIAHDAQGELFNLKEYVLSIPQVSQVNIDFLWYSQLKSMMNLSQTISWGIGLVLLSTVIIITNYTIRMSLEKHRDEIAIYQDLGASYSFIQRPFLYQGLMLAGAGALLTILLLAIGYLSLSADVRKLESLFNISIFFSYADTMFSFQCIVVMIFFAWLSSLASIRKWLYLFDKNQSAEKLI